MNESYELIRDTTGKKVFYKNKQKKNTHLAVFVHGFTGNYLSTWGKLPELLLSDPRLLHYDFLFWGYSSSLLFPNENFFLDNIRQLFSQFLNKHKTNQRIEVISQGLQTELNYMDNYENISLIGHSLGGLVIRSYIIQNLIENKTVNKNRIQKIDNIILLGTPNEGVDIANNKILGLLNNQIADMGSYNEFINKLREDWVDLVFKNDDIKFKTLMVAGEDDYFVPFEQVTKYFRDSRELTKGDHITMAKPESIHDTTYKILTSNLLNIDSGKDSKIIELNQMIQNENTPITLTDLLHEIKKLITHRGLDDKTLTKTIAAQYFVFDLAKKLKLTKNTDYQNLMDLFLKSFYIKVDNSIVFSEEVTRMTPKWLAKMKKSMLAEDNKDDYYSRFDKNAAQNIDMFLVRANFHYGLMTQMSRQSDYSKSMILNLIQELAINRLIYGNGKKPLDDHGGWYPQRMPWITARILTSLKKSGYYERNDKIFIEEIINKALDYLILSIYKERYWRSGVGEWVTKWETTALCLEAIYSWEKISIFESKITPVIKYLIENEAEWLFAPNFDSEVKSNRTLGSVTLLCILLIIINKNFNNKFAIDYEKYYLYLFRTLETINKSKKLTIRQLCTVPQIVYYITKLIKNIDETLIN